MSKPSECPAVVQDLRKRLEKLVERGELGDLASVCGVSYHTLIKIHNGQTPNPTVATFVRIEEGLAKWSPVHGFKKPQTALLLAGS